MRRHHLWICRYALFTDTQRRPQYSRDETRHCIAVCN